LVKKNRILLLYIQFAIAKNLTGLYKAIQEGKRELKRLKDKINESPNPEEKLSLEKKLEDIQIRIFAHKNVARIIKTIVDGIIWRNLNFDRSILRFIASNRKTGHIDINEEGFKGVLNTAKSMKSLRRALNQDF